MSNPEDAVTRKEKIGTWSMAKRGRVVFEVEGATQQEAFNALVADAKELQAARKQIAELTALVQTNRDVHHMDALSWQKTVTEWEGVISQSKIALAERDATIASIRAEHMKDAIALNRAQPARIEELEKVIEAIRAGHDKDARELAQLKHEQAAQRRQTYETVITSDGRRVEFCTQCGHPCSGCDWNNYRVPDETI